ncbi:MAG: orotidine-5'-phosphate decarboxylase, partial [Desulfobacterales bacterium]
LKLHDIPATVSRAMQNIADLGVAFATVHCGETSRMLEAAVKGGKDEVGVLGVTVLTSILNKDLESAGFRKIFYDDLTRLVVKRAAMAKQAGCKGIVCSALEVKMIKETFGQDFIAVTPGIRPDWDTGGENDQRRVTTPSRAVDDGSDYLVIGRPIRDAKDPKEAAARIAEEIETVL